MATSTEQISNLIGGYTSLKEYFESARGDIDARLNTAEQRVGDTHRIFILDQVNGNDANDGGAGGPLKTMGEVAARSVRGGLTSVILRSDYREEEDQFSLPFGALKVNLNGFKLSWSSYVDDGRAARWRMSMDFGGLGFVQLEGGTVEVGYGPSTATTEGRTFIRGRGIPINLTLTGCTLDLGSDPGAGFSPGYLMAPPGGLFLGTTSHPAGMAGRWINGVAAATDPGTLPLLAYTNLTSL